MRARLIALFCALPILGLVLSGDAQAVPWCHKGKIAVISTQAWDANQILAHFALVPSTPAVCSGVIAPTNVDYCKTFYATEHFARSLAGGNPGRSCRQQPPDVMTTRAIPTGPTTYTQGGNYDVSQGVQFRVEKCFCNSVDAAQPLPKELAR
jgi:hypothetical protein